MANKFLKTATALTIMGTSLLGAGAFTAKADNTDSLKFNDVPANHWSTKAIYDLTNRKVVQGYGNNIFGFGDNVTRGQVARMIYMYVKPVDADASFKNPFTDIKGHMFEKEIRALAKAGLVSGYGDAKYGPDDVLTREQMAQVLTNAFKFKSTKTTSFTDIDKNSWALKAISALEENGVTIGTGGKMYSPYAHVTRGQVARMIYMYVKPVDADASFKNPFTDIKGHLFEKEIRALAKAGLVNGFGDGKYGPDDILTREQMAQVLKNAFKFKATKTTKFADVDKNSWSYDAISALEENGVTIGTGGNMYSPKMFVTREAYSQFLFNSINAVEKEEKPEVKPDPKPETKPEEKPEVKPDPKPETKPEEKPEVKPDPKPETKPEEKPEVKPDPKPETNLPSSIDKGLVTEEVTYNPNAMKNPIAQKSISTEAQNLIKSVNAKFGTNLKYADLNGTIRIIDKNMYLPEGTIGAQVYVNATSENDFKIIFLDNNEATIELAKKWTTMLNSDLVLDKEIQETVDAQEINNYEKGKYKIRVGHSTADHMMYIQVRV